MPIGVKNANEKGCMVLSPTLSVDILIELFHSVSSESSFLAQGYI